MKKPEALRRGPSSIPLWMKRIFKIRTRTQAIYICLILFTGITSCFLLLKASFWTISETLPENYIDPYNVSTYFLPRKADSNFPYSAMIPDNNRTCLKRDDNFRDFFRLFGFQPGQPSQNESYVFVFGAETAIGKEVVKLLAKRKIKALKWPHADTLWPYMSTRLLFQEHDIIGAIVCDMPYSIDSRYSYYKGVCELVSSFQKPFEVLISTPYVNEYLEMLKWYGAHLVFIQSYLDTNSFDLTSPFVNAVTECRLLKTTKYVNDLEFNIIEPVKIAEILIKELFEIEPNHITVSSGTKGSFEYMVRRVAREIEGCEAVEDVNEIPVMPDLGESIVIGKPSDKMGKLMDKAVKNLPIKNLTDVYISVVVYGKNSESKSETKIQNAFLKHFAYGVRNSPLAKLELIIVDTTEKGKKPLSEVLKFEDELRGITRIIPFSDDSYGVKPTKFNAWNIGIRRAKGSFVLTCSMNDLISVSFFKDIVSQMLDKRIVYTTSVWMAEEVDKVPLGFNHDTLSNNMFIGEMCISNGFGFKLIYSKDRANDYEFCGALDFLLCSKEIWAEMYGMPEFNTDNVENPDFLVKMRFLRMFPGIFSSGIRTHVIRVFNNEEGEKTNNGEVLSFDINNLLDQYLCKGSADEIEPYNNEKWGLEGVELNEIQI